MRYSTLCYVMICHIMLYHVLGLVLRAHVQDALQVGSGVPPRDPVAGPAIVLV